MTVDDIPEVAKRPPRRPIQQHIIRTRFGWGCETIHGTARLEGVMFSFTERGIHRKAARLRRRLQREQQRRTEARSITTN